MDDRKKISIKDVAKELGVSISTVSFVLNGLAEEKRISGESVKKILDYVKTVDYQPNPFARGLRTGKSSTIGLLVESIADPFFSQIAAIIEESAAKEGYGILYGSTSNNTEKTRLLINVFKDRKVDGYIIAAPLGIKEDIVTLQKSRIPIVLFDRKVEGVDEIDYVSVNNHEGVYNGVEHLIQGGYRNIAFITLDSLQSQMQERLMGYEKAIADYKLNTLVKELSSHHDMGQIVNQITAFLKFKPETDAIFFATNYLGLSGLRAIKELKLNITSDLAVIIFDDADVFDLHTPGITTIGQPIEQLAEQAISLMLSRLKNNKMGNKQIVLPTSLKIRESSLSRDTQAII